MCCTISNGINHQGGTLLYVLLSAVGQLWAWTALRLHMAIRGAGLNGKC
jgi:hypothetical protein